MSGFMGPLFDPGEAERLVQQLQPVSLLELGTMKWLEQHKIWERLNAVSHRAAATSSEDLALSTLLTFEKLHLAVQGAITVESWKNNVLPKLVEPIIDSPPSTGAPLKTYYILHSEAILVNLLETTLYHSYAAEALGDSGLLDLVDYCMRQVNRLIVTTHARNSLKNDPEAKRRLEGNADPAAEAFRKAAAARSTKGGEGDDDEDTTVVAAGSSSAAAAAKRIDELSKESPAVVAAKQLASQCRDFTFQIGCACVTILRFLSDHLPKLPLTVIGRILDFHDLSLVMVPLVENPPWTRRIKRPAPSGSGKTLSVWQKFVDRKWQDVPSSDLLKLTPQEGQPWLTLYNLLQEPEVRKRYEMHSHRKGTLTRVRRYLNDALTDQIPMLTELQRTLDELAVTVAPDIANAQSVRTALLLEPVIEMQANVEKEAFRHTLVQEALKSLISSPSSSSSAAGAASEGSSAAKTEKEKGESAAAPSAPSPPAPAVATDTSLLSFGTHRPAAPTALLITPQAAQPPQPPSAMVSEVVMVSGSSSSASSSSTVAITPEKQWEAVTAVVSKHLFPPSSSPKSKKAGVVAAKGLSPAADVRALAALYTEDEALFESLVAAATLNEAGGSSFSSSGGATVPAEILMAPKCNVCGEPAEKRCGRCANVWYCSREHQLYDWKEGGHKPLCDIVANANAQKAKEGEGAQPQQAASSKVQEA